MCLNGRLIIVLPCVLQGWVFFSSFMCFPEKLWISSWTRETHMSVCKRRATRGDNLIVEPWSWIHRNRYDESFPFVFEQTGLRLCIFFPRVLNGETLILNWTILKSQQVFWSESFDSELTLTESIQWILNIWSIWLKRLLHSEGKELFELSCNILFWKHCLLFLSILLGYKQTESVEFSNKFILLFHFHTKYMTIVLNWVDLFEMMSPTSWNFKKRIDYKHC